jgi:hypothetical protein
VAVLRGVTQAEASRFRLEDLDGGTQRYGGPP